MSHAFAWRRQLASRASGFVTNRAATLKTRSGPESSSRPCASYRDGLIPASDRSKNDGLSPTFFVTWRRYRRALQVQRLRSFGIKGRDALRVQLFIHGYGLKVSEVRGAVRDEFLRGLRELRPQLRSQYFQNGREPGPGHLAAAERQLGSLDPRFASAGLKQPVQFMLKNTRIGFGVAVHSVLAALEGLLLGGLNHHPLPKLGLAPTGKRRLVTAHTLSRHSGPRRWTPHFGG